jgi:hypothetical protein
MSEKPWLTLGEVAARLHVARMTAWRLLRPFRGRCHLARAGSHPRLVLWVPAEVLRELESERPRKAGSAKTPSSPFHHSLSP